jgi:aminopeptidase YwaD
MRLIWLLVLLPSALWAQRKRSTNPVATNIKAHVQFLADDKLEGRRAGSKGEATAAQYIAQAFAKAGLLPKGNNGFLQGFEVDEGKQMDAATKLSINGVALEPKTDFFPLAYSANGSVAGKASSMDLPQQTLLMDIAPLLAANSQNPHFELETTLKEQLKDKKANCILLFNSGKAVDNLQLVAKDKSLTAAMPIVYVTRSGLQKAQLSTDSASMATVALTVALNNKKRNCTNVVGFVDNKAANTVVIGAHFDHLGYGEDHNSMYKGEDKQIHNGADDNASGTAALLELASMLKAQKNIFNNNYLFVAFSAEELGLFGSKYFVEHCPVPTSNINYMVNMDMVGRLNDSSRMLTVGGYGTSPTWTGFFDSGKEKYLKFRYDSSGSGPSDHTSFYRSNIPVVFLFTGLHGDYHKPSDDADKVNAVGAANVVRLVRELVQFANDKGKLTFLKTREPQMSTARFSVSLGVMPDYTYSKTGVRIDGVSEGKLAQKLGLQAGDVLVQLGEYKFTDVSSYMQTLSKFKKGDATQLKVLRGDKELQFDIVF